MSRLPYSLCLYFPLLPLEIFTLTMEEDRPFALEHRVKNRRCISMCNAVAKSQGIKPGMSISQAYSLIPELLVQCEDTQQQTQALQQLAIWAYDISPDIFLHNNHALMIEVSSCLKMHGNLNNLLLFIEKKSQQIDCHCSASITHSFLGAYLLAQQYFLNSSEKRFQHQYLEMNALHYLPLFLMDINASQKEKLTGMGFKTLGDLFKIPEAALHKRFGADFICQLHEIKGESIPALEKFVLPDKFSRTTSFIEELEQVEQLIFPLQRLLSELCNDLLVRQKTLRQLKITLGFREHKSEPLLLGLSQNRQAHSNFVKEMVALLRLKFSNYTLQAPVILLSLDVEHFFPLQQQSDDLFAPQKSSKESPEALLDQLQARLGPSALQGMSAQEDHRPDRAFSLQSLNCNQDPATPLLLPERPLWLLKEPRPLMIIDQQPRMNGPIQLLKGPERIASGWWDHAPIQRDYFIARHHNGALYWIFQTLEEKRWYLHGIFS